MRAIRLKLIHALSKALRSLSFPEKEFSLAPPKISEFGDLSSNIALLLARDLNRPPMDICKSFGVPIESMRHEPDESLDVDATIIIGKDINTFSEVFAYISSVK